jgi:hypothetical protein
MLKIPHHVVSAILLDACLRSQIAQSSLEKSVLLFSEQI